MKTELTKKQRLEVIQQAERIFKSRWGYEYACPVIWNALSFLQSIIFTDCIDLPKHIPELRQFKPKHKRYRQQWWKDNRTIRIILFKHLKRAIRQGKKYDVQTFKSEIKLINLNKFL